MTDHQFTDEQQDVLRKVEKLLRLAAKNPNEAEAASASSKAMELLAAYNLSTAALEIGIGDSGRRAEEKVIGGFYEFERELWDEIAKLNFCWYFTQVKYIPFEERKKHRGRKFTNQHVIIGKVVNIAGTKAMAGYLMQAIERITKEQLEERGKLHPRSSWAVSFRRGMAERIARKVMDRRWDMEKEERKAREELRRAATDAQRAGASTSTALTLASVKQAEHEANYDFVYGEGAYAEVQANRKRAAEAQRRAEEEYTRWAAEHPEEAAKEAREAEKREARNAARRKGRSWSSGPAFKGDWSAYNMGMEAGDRVGIDPQAEGGSSRRLLK